MNIWPDSKKRKLPPSPLKMSRRLHEFQTKRLKGTWQIDDQEPVTFNTALHEFLIDRISIFSPKPITNGLAVKITFSEPLAVAFTATAVWTMRTPLENKILGSELCAYRIGLMIDLSDEITKEQILEFFKNHKHSLLELKKETVAEPIEATSDAPREETKEATVEAEAAAAPSEEEAQAA